MTTKHSQGELAQIHIAGFHEFQAGKKAAGEVLCEQATALGAEAIIVARRVRDDRASTAPLFAPPPHHRIATPAHACRHVTLQSGPELVRR